MQKIIYIMKAKEKLLDILNGSNFYFHFTRVAVYKNGTRVLTLTDNNCEDSATIFKKKAVFSQLDFRDTMAYIQQCGVFVGMYSGFDILLEPSRWFVNTDEPTQYSICYNVHSGSIDDLILIAEGDNVRLQINTGSYNILLADVMNFH